MDHPVTSAPDNLWSQSPPISGRTVASVLSVLMSAAVLVWGAFFAGG
jgi:hypothetical protein